MTQHQDELDRIKAVKASLLAHCEFAIRANADLNSAEKDDAVAHIEQALDDAFFREINSLETDIDWEVSITRQKQDAADLADLRDRS